jgi:PmbA protein
VSGEPPDADELLASGERALKALARSRADEGEVFMQKGWGRSYTLEGGSIKYGSFGGDFGLGVRVVKDGRLGFGYCTREKDLGRTIKAAVSMCRISPRTGFRFPEPGRAKTPKKTFDPAILDLQDPDGLSMVKEMLDGAREVSNILSFPGGGVGFGAEAFCVLNTRGVAAADRGTYLSAGLSTMLGKEGSPQVSTGSFDDFTRTSRLDMEGIGARAAQLAVDSRGARPLDKPGTMDVVMAPDAFSELAEYLLASSFCGDRVSRKESHYTGKVGERVAHEGLTMLDDGLLADGPNTAAVDDEGVPSSRTSLMSGGVVKGFIYDVTAAEESGRAPTGNGARVERFGSDRSFKVTPRTRVQNLVMKWERRRSLDDILGEIKNGVYVHELLGSHTANIVSGDFSVGSPLLFRVRKGEVREPVQGAMLAGNLFDALKSLGGMADDFRNVTGSLSSVAVKTPSVWLTGINVMK